MAACRALIPLPPLAKQEVFPYSKKLCIVRQVYGPRNKDLIAPGVRPTKKALLRPFCLQVYGPGRCTVLARYTARQVYGPSQFGIFKDFIPQHTFFDDFTPPPLSQMTMVEK